VQDKIERFSTFIKE
jgi:hypothetical protein